MSVPFYAKSPENQGYIKNMEVVGFCDLNGVNAFQMALHKTDDGRYYMYCGSFRGPGWNVVDVTDPTQPKVVNWLEACDPKEYPATNTPKIQVADGLMIGATGGGVSFLHGCKPGDKSLGSLQIFDIKTDPVHPKLLGKWETGVENGMGVHRFFYNGGRYVHLSADCPGYTGNIYRILDIIDPNPPGGGGTLVGALPVHRRPEGGRVPGGRPPALGVHGLAPAPRASVRGGQLGLSVLLL